MSKKYYACVFGGASDRIEDKYKKQIEILGKVIVDNGFSLVYGAGATGCMGAIAKGVQESGGYVMGVTPDFIKDFEDIFPCDNTIMVDTMAERKMLMEKHADIFIITPGGLGTMDEFFQVITLKYLKRLSAPIFILNTDGFYNTLIKFLEDLVDKKAATDIIHTMYEVIESVDDEKLINAFKEIKSK